jgi:tetratricopeptide (TPR) repeat protein
MMFRPLLLAAALLGTTLAQAVTTPLEQAQSLWLAGHKQEALSQVQAELSRTPDDLKLRFTLGVYRMELHQADEAEKIFTVLTQDFPDLADPYNNLAVLHAAKGELDQARADLEQALRLQPDHAQAQENLGDLMLRLAVRAYERAQAALPAPSPTLALKIKQAQGLVLKSTPTPAP